MSCWASSNHESVSSKNRSVLLVLFLRLLPRLALLVVLLQHLDGRALLSKVVDHEWHREIGETVTP